LSGKRAFGGGQDGRLDPQLKEEAMGVGIKRKWDGKVAKAEVPRIEIHEIVILEEH
jgi:hypothetical protein